MVSKWLEKFAKGAIVGLLSDPKVLFETVSSVIEAYLEEVPLDALLDTLDKNPKPEEIYKMIPESYIKRLVNAIGDVDEESMKKIRAYAVKYITPKNVMLYLRKNNLELYTILINHPNGKSFLENFIKYTLENLDSIMRRRG